MSPSEADTTQSKDIPTAADEELVDEDSLIEEVSIDGMCGVY